MRLGGLAAIAFVVLSALVRVWTPQTQAPEQVKPITIPANAALKEGQQKQTPASGKAMEQGYPVALKERIRDFFGTEHSPDAIGQKPPCQDRGDWCVPEADSEGVLFVIATVPDPVHSHLSLFFDRSIDAIVDGVSAQGYLLDRSVMPWHYSGDSNPDETREQATLRESYPGLMIFRGGPKTDPIANPMTVLEKPPLFVFIVGETPTSGINKEQFHHALEIIRSVHPVKFKKSPSSPEFGILGPTFSGSLYSLSVILNADAHDSKAAAGHDNDRTLPVYSTVMGTVSIISFQLSAPRHVRMAVFEEDAAVVFEALRQYVVDLDYQDKDLAVLSEDETAYGTPPASASAPKVLYLYFPRGISQFRSEYSSEFQSPGGQDQSGAGNQQEQRNLRLDLAVTGTDRDSVAPYNKSQTPLSQEGVMLGIVSELRLREPKFILLRATDPLDVLFLARYLRGKYPQGRLVVPSPDLLFSRDEGGQLDGVLGLNTYALSPAQLNTTCAPRTYPIIFPSSTSAALYNAATSLVETLSSAASVPPPASKSSTPAAPPKQPGKSQAASTQALGVQPDLNACLNRMSPNLWLTIVSGNSIHPLKILRTSGSLFFPHFYEPRTHQELKEPKEPNWESEHKQRDTRIPPTWFFPYALCLAMQVIHLYLTWTGGTSGQWLTPTQFHPPQRPFQNKAKILCLGGIILVGIFVALLSANTPARFESAIWQAVLNVSLWIPLAAFVGLTGWDFWQRREERLLCCLFVGTSAFVTAGTVSFVWWMQQDMVLWQQRTLDLTSGISPVTPLVLLLMAFYCWFWYSFRGESLTDWRSPQLPEATALPEKYYRLSQSANDRIRQTTGPFAGPWWVDLIAVLAVACLAGSALLVGPGHAPLRSLEGLWFDAVFSILLGLALVVLIATLLRILALWWQFNLMLTALDRIGLRDALQRLSGLGWDVIWNPTRSMEKEGFKLVGREIETIQRLGISLDGADDSSHQAKNNLRKLIAEIEDISKGMLATVHESSKSYPSAIVELLMEPFKALQLKFAETAGLLCKSFLDISWQHLPAESDIKPADEATERSGAKINVGTALIKVGVVDGPDAAPPDASGLSHASLELAEEFFGSIYSNVLVTVLLRIRGLVFSAVAIYVCVVFSTICYPFEPAPEVSALAIGLFLLSGAVIGYVYEAMHRDPALSRMTSTVPGKLDSSFWGKFVAAGIVPLVALVSTVYAPFGHLLYSLVGPLLQALR